LKDLTFHKKINDMNMLSVFTDGLDYKGWSKMDTLINQFVD